MNITTLFRSTLLTAILSLSCVAQAQVTFNLTTGWNLLGNSSAAPIDVTTTFGDSSKINTVWKWNKTAGKWAFYAPSMPSADLTAYATSKGYDVLTSIASKEGFWVKASTAATLIGPTAAGVTLTEGDLAKGWNLVGSADSKTPAQLNQSFNNSLSTAGKGIVTTWAWDAPTAKWKFYAPSLATQGGTALNDYIGSNGYLPPTTISSTEGIWINVGAVTPVIQGIPPLPTSYENAKAMPQLHIPQRGSSSLLASAYASADFFQTGKPVLFAATYRYESWIQTEAEVVGNPKYLSDFDFWDKDAAGNDVKILSFKGCVHPRKAVVADFNKDGYPDIFVACHGYDAGTYPGEKSKLILSNGHGGFTVTDVGKVGYWHTAAAADVNGDGYPDVVVSNEYESPATYFLINNKDGTFAEDHTRLVGRNQIYFALELVDVDGDGNLDLVVGYDDSVNKYPELRTVTSILYGDNNGYFGARSSVIPPVPGRGAVIDFTVVTNNGVRGLYIGRYSTPDSGLGLGNSTTLQWFNPATLESVLVFDAVTHTFPSAVFFYTKATQNGQNGVIPATDDFNYFFSFVSH